MRLLELVGALILAAVCLPILAVASEGDASEGALLFFRSPPAIEPALGTVTVEVEVVGSGVAEVVLLVDGRERGRLAGEPFRIPVEFGDEFGPHRFEAVALDEAGGELARAVRETPGLLVDDRVQLDLRQLYVTVTAATNRATALGEEDFEVRDEGIPQTIVTFEGGDAALTVALLVDASESMHGGRLEAALAGAHAFLSGMHELDEASVMLFSDVIRSQTAPSQEAALLAGELTDVEAGGGTALNDALFLALEQLEERQGRRVVVLLSDGFDIHSVLGIDDVLRVMRRSRSLVYWIEVTEGRGDFGITTPWRDSASHAAEKEGLRQLVTESGGRVVTIEQVAEATEAFQAILTELREQYVLGYYPSVELPAGTWHRVRVDVDRPGFRVRTRGGYVE